VPAEEKGYSRTEPGSGETVLIIDDESTVRMLIVEVLEENGYTAIEAVDCESASNFDPRQNRPKLLIDKLFV
jgi:CheY-like chemotaxis protein